MKKLLTALTLTTLMFFVLSCGGSKSTVEEDISAVLPADTLGLIQFNSTESFIKTMSFMFDCEMCQKSGVSEIKDKLGLDITNPAGFTDKGIDIKKGFGIAITDAMVAKDKQAVSIILYLPLIDEKLAAEKLKEKLPEGKVVKKGHIMTLKTGKEDIEMGYSFSKGYLLIGVAYNGKLDNLLKERNGKLLKDNSTYTELRGLCSKDKTVFAYFNTAVMPEKFKGYMELMQELSKNPWSFNSLKYLNSYKGGYISLDVSTKDLIVDSYFLLSDNNSITKLFDGVKFDKKPVLSVEENPVMFVSMGMNMVEYYKMIISSLPEDKQKEAEAGVSNVAGINLYKELIENLAGNINLGIYDGKTINMTNYNVVLSFNVKDKDVMSKLLDKLIALTPEKNRQMIRDEKINGVDSKVLGTPVFQMYAGMKDGSFILSFNRKLYEKALIGDTSKGFATRIKDAELKKSLEGNNQSFYFNIPEAMHIYSTFAAFGGANKAKLTPEQISAINKLGYLYSTEAKTDKHVEQHMKVKTTFSKPFMEGIADMVKLFDKKESNTPPPPPPPGR